MINRSAKIALFVVITLSVLILSWPSELNDVITHSLPIKTTPQLPSLNDTIPATNLLPYRNTSFVFHATNKLDDLKCPKAINFTGFNTKPIPKFVWTFWNSGTIPEFIEKCINGWKNLNPDHLVTVITPTNMKEIIRAQVPSSFSNLTGPAQSDWVRLAVLTEYGGIWLDSSIILTESLQHIHDKQLKHKSEGFMYYLDVWSQFQNSPLLESWFIASIPNGQFITSWFHEFNRVVVDYEFSNQYLDDLKEKYGEKVYKDLLQGNSMPDYLKIHVALQKVIQIDGVYPPHTEAAECNPYSVLFDFNWDSEKAALALMEKWIKPLPKMLKLRSHERTAIIKFSKFQIGHPKSIYKLFIDRS